MSISGNVRPEYLGTGDPALKDYYPAWVNNMADDATVEGSMLDGAVQGAEAVRSVVLTIRSLYEHQEFKFAGPYGDNGFLEDYVAKVNGEPIGCVVLITRNAAGQTQHVVASYRPRTSLLLFSRLLGEKFAGTPIAEHFTASEPMTLTEERRSPGPRSTKALERVAESQFTVLRPCVHTVEADGVRVFYRAAGNSEAPVVLLLHGFPTSSFMFRELIPRLADHYRVIAPDLPGFGFTEVPAERKYAYSFDGLASTVDAFTRALKIDRYAIYVFDYGAPTGLRLAMAHPERITAIISQNGNAYEEGLGDAWAPIRKYWSSPTPENREVIRQNILTREGTRRQYTHGASDPESVPPESYTLDAALLERPGNKDIQLDLFLDYASNVALYPKFQEYFRQSNPPLLAIWGKNDPFFVPAGAAAFRKDLPNAVVQFLDTGHFAIETHVVEIAAAMKEFLAANGIGGSKR